MDGDSVGAYLASLPRGLGSYPQCTSKATSVTFELERRPTPARPHLPEEVRHILLHPPLSNAWIPTTVFVATTLAIEAHHGITDETLAIESTDAMIASPLYGLMLRMLTPSMILRGGAATWNLFHRGTTLRADRIGAHLEARMSFPVGLFPLEVLSGFAAGFQRIVGASWKKDAVVRLVDHGPTFAVYRLT